MWDVFKNAVTGVKDALGIELPELPVDLGAFDTAPIGEAATTAVQGVTDSATGVTDAVAAAGETATTTVQGVTEAVSGASQSAR
jgi:hypothetical protein